MTDDRSGAAGSGQTEQENGLPFRLLGEDDYLDAMNGPCRAWRGAEVKNGTYVSFDGTRLNYYYAVPAHPRAVILMIHGFCEFFTKYHEMAWYFFRAGYAFFFPEMRGHGLSEGKLPEKDVVYVRRYSDYVKDAEGFALDVAVPEALRQHVPLLLFAHSMGGAVGALLLERDPELFAGAVLSSPMLLMKTGGMSKAMIALFRVYVALFHKWKHLSVKQKHFDGVPVFETSSCQSRPRYDYMFAERLRNENYQTYGASFAWVLASISANKKLLRHADRIRTPLLIFEAGQDHLVEPEGYQIFTRNLPEQTERTLIRYDSARHEIFNATPEVRQDYYARIFRFFSEYASGGGAGQDS